MAKKDNTPVIIKPGDLREIGEIWGGSHWQADLARGCDISSSQITRILNTSRQPDTILSKNVQKLMVEKIGELGAKLHVRGLPAADSADTKRAQKMIAEAVKLMETQLAD